MRKSKIAAAGTRKHIIETAAWVFKQRGVDGACVSEIMSVAGISHGGFYRHFSSKEQLLKEACAANMEALIEKTRTLPFRDENAFLLHIESLLSSELQEDCLGGCPLTSLGSELARADAETRQITTQGLKKLVDTMTKHVSTNDAADMRESVLFTLALMVGAVTMARIVNDEDLSHQIIDSARRHVKNTFYAGR